MNSLIAAAIFNFVLAALNLSVVFHYAPNRFAFGNLLIALFNFCVFVVLLKEAIHD